MAFTEEKKEVERVYKMALNEEKEISNQEVDDEEITVRAFLEELGYAIRFDQEDSIFRKIRDAAASAGLDLYDPDLDTDTFRLFIEEYKSIIFEGMKIESFFLQQEE
jgi:hypothetical protein